MVAAILFAGVLIAKAEVFSFHADVQGGTWSGQDWVPNTGVAPGTTDGSVSKDQVTIDNIGTGAVNVTLDESRNLARLTRLRADTTEPGDSIRLVSGSSGGNLVINDLFSVEDGALYLRAGSSDTVSRLAIEADRMEVGSTEWNGAAPAGKSVGTVFLSGEVAWHDNSRVTDYSRVTLKVNKTLTLIGNGRFVFEGNATGEAEIDLGDVVFQDNVFNNIEMNPGFSLGSAVSSDIEHRVRLRSLQSEEANSSKIIITGGATLELYGNAPMDAADHRFYGEIGEVTRLEKTGSNTQAFSRSAGNSYRGGTLISAGTLLVENGTGSGLGTGSVTVDGTGILGGNGQIALGQGMAISVRAGGMLAPGHDGVLPNNLRIVVPEGSSEPTVRLEGGARCKFTMGAKKACAAIEFLNYTAGALSLDAGGVEIVLEGVLSEGVYPLFVFREGGEGSELVSSGFSEGLYVKQKPGNFHITLHYNDPELGGTGIISMKVTPVAASQP